MHPSPRHVALLIGLIAAWAGAAPPAAAKPTPAEELAQLRAQIQKLKRDIDSAEESKADVLDQLRDSERAISDLNRSLHALATEQRAVAEALAAAQQRSAALRSHIRSQQSVLAHLLRQQYMQPAQDPLRLVLALKNPNEIARQTIYYRYLSRSRATLIASLREDLQATDAAEAEVRQQHAALARILAQQENERRALHREASQRRATLARLEQQIAARRKQVAQLARDEQRLTRLVQQLSRVVPTRPRGAAPRPGPPPGPIALKPGTPLPVAGELSNRFGSPRPDTGTAWRGWFIRAPAGSPVKAAETGQVVFADWLRGFGNLLIIDHGDGYMSLYGNNEALLKQEGDRVRRGEPVAAVGNSGGNPETGLYFEVRYQSRPIDPASWLNRR